MSKASVILDELENTYFINCTPRIIIDGVEIPYQYLPGAAKVFLDGYEICYWPNPQTAYSRQQGLALEER